MSSLQKAAPIRQLSLCSPAKVNLFFRVLFKREDGFHEIASIYQAVDLCDVLHVSIFSKDQFTCSDPSLPLDEKNLVQRALSLFRKKTGLLTPFSIHLEKNIPQEAGLGGGSSNAATALYAFTHLLDCSFSMPTLASWGAELGSDVPFFFSSGTAYVTGRGDLLEDLLPSVKLTSFWIAKPPFGSSTALVYRECSKNSFAKRDPRQDKKAFLEGNIPLYNDLEGPAFSLSTDLASVKERLLKSGFSSVVLTGSGSAFICIGNPQEKGDLLQGLQLFPVKTLQRKEPGWYE